jgi:hypothetical protein
MYNEAEYREIVVRLDDIITNSPDAIARELCAEIKRYLNNMVDISHDRIADLEARLVRNPGFANDLIGWLADDFE